jgi:hypothetical protein
MRTTHQVRDHPLGMRDLDTTRVELELIRDCEPISGRVQVVGEAARQFAGVLELIAVLDRARAGESGERSAPDAPPAG